MLAIAIAAHLAKVSESLLKGDSPYFVIFFCFVRVLLSYAPSCIESWQVTPGRKFIIKLTSKKKKFMVYGIIID